MAADDVATVAALDAARGVFRDEIARHGGRVVDMAGDSVLAVFDTTLGAATAALEIQVRLGRTSETTQDDRRLRFRIGIHLGDVIEKSDGTVYGGGVNVASRLQALADPGGVVVSQSVENAIGGRGLARFVDMGEHRVKNIPKPLRVLRASAERVQAQQAICAVPAHIETPSSANSPATNVPTGLDDIVGRDSDVAMLMRLLHDERLVTIVGMGGIGKTRLAQVVARQRLDQHRDGVWWVDLAALSSADKLAAAIASAANLDLADGDPMAMLARALGQRDMLLVLDNCEHLVADVAHAVSAALGKAARLRVLATSQEALNVAGEQVYRLDSLAVPPPGTTLVAARGFGALRLLEQRALAAGGGFALTEGSIGDAIELCRRLDGIPLAIEMVAARLPVLGLHDVGVRLGERFRLLRSSRREAPARHQTLRAALEWSHSLLSEAERRVLRRLSVFVGSFRLDVAQTSAATEECDDWSVLDVLVALAEKSLLQVESTDPPRYRLLETVRLYASERLDEHRETAIALQRHGDAMSRLAGEAIEAFWVTADAAWSTRYAADMDDLEAAFARACKRQDAATVVSTGQALALRDQRSGGAVRSAKCRRTEAAYSLLPLAPPSAQAQIWSWMAAAKPFEISGVPRLVAAQEAVAAWQKVGDAHGLYMALGQLAVELQNVGEFDAASDVLARAAGLEDPAWPPRLRGALANNLSLVSVMRGDASEYRRAVGRELVLAEQAGAVFAAAFARLRLADAAAAAGDFDEAVALGRAVVAEQRVLPRGSSVQVALQNLCGALLMQGDLESARDAAKEAWPLALQHGMIGYLLDSVAFFATRVGQHADAAQLLGRANAAYAANHVAREPNEARSVRLAEASIAEAIGQDDLAHSMTAGAMLTDDQTDRLVRSVLSQPMSGKRLSE